MTMPEFAREFFFLFKNFYIPYYSHRTFASYDDDVKIF